MSLLKHLPNSITSLRFALVLPLITALDRYDVALAVGLLMLIMLSDVLDGWLARRWHVCSSFGAYLDASADFTVLFAAFGMLVAHGVYPAWLLMLIGGMFGQFVLTARFKAPVYDPMGKYFGALLYGVVLALLLPDLLLSYTLLAIIVGMTTLSLYGRGVLLLKRRSV